MVERSKNCCAVLPEKPNPFFLTFSVISSHGKRKCGAHFGSALCLCASFFGPKNGSDPESSRGRASPCFMTTRSPTMSAPKITTQELPGPVLPTHQVVRTVAGLDTHVLLQSFTDRLLVIVTQVGKIGCLIQATTPSSLSLAAMSASAPLSQDAPPLPSSLTRLFGTPPAGLETLYDLYVSQIASLVRSTSPNRDDTRPIVVGIGLKHLSHDQDPLSDAERERLLQILDMIKQCPL